MSHSQPSAATPRVEASSGPEFWSEAFASALSYEAFLSHHATPDQRGRWEAFAARVELDEPQRSLLAGFQRRMPVLVVAGAWCGDCVSQCPIFERFAAASPAIDLRFLDRDARPDVAQRLAVCGGQRVPVVQFLSEDWHPVLAYGDKTLAAYREAASGLGESCATGLIGEAEKIAAVAADWLREFERVQLLLRLSGRLRRLHGD